MQLISLFSGIGGFELASEWMGWDNVVSCEINSFGQQVLKYYWPNAYHHDDIHTLTYEKIKEQSRWDENKPTVIVGGFPCQPYSAAGKRLGKDDDRHLWPQMLRVIREVQPTWIVGENVFGLVNWSDGLVFEEVQSDLESEGYEVQPYVLPAASVGAPHRRDRVWFVAKNTMCSRRVFGKLEQERAKDGQQRNTCAGDCNGLCKEKNARVAVDPNHTGGGARLGQVSKTYGEVLKRHDNAELGNASDGVVADAKGNGNRRELRGLETENAKFGKPKKCWKDNLQLGYDGGVGVTANANNQRRKECNITAKSSSAQRITRSNHEFTTNTEQPGRKRREWFAESERLKSGAWDNWPTVEPTICRDNDGFSERLVGITFSKHRNESIKAYGNAVVPQVVYQIFKAIQAYEDEYK